MPKILQLTYFSVAIAVFALAAGFLLAGFPLATLSALLIGALWGLSTQKDWVTGETISLVLMVLVISFAGLLNAARILLLVSALGTLAAWDLGNFHRTRLQNENIANAEHLTREHLSRLLVVLMIGVALPLIAFSLQFELQFWQVFAMGFILLFGLGQIFIRLKRSDN